MQWKGPFEVSSVAGLNDYKVKVKGKEKVYHANLLKKYFEREETTAEGAVAGGVGATCIYDAVNCAAKADEADLVQHHIKLISDEPVRSRPYPVPYSIRESLRRDIADIKWELLESPVLRMRHLWP